MSNPALAWNLICAALFTWGFGAVVTLHAAAYRSCRGSALWLLAPVFWPLALPIWAWVLWRERVDERRYFESRVAARSEEVVRLVPDGTPYGSPVRADGRVIEITGYPRGL